MEKQFYKWYKNVNKGNVSGQDFLYPGRPLTSQADENIKNIHEAGRCPQRICLPWADCEPSVLHYNAEASMGKHWAQRSRIGTPRNYS